MSERLDTLTCEDFTPYLHQTFQISLANCNLDPVTDVEIPGLTLGDSPTLAVTLIEAVTIRPSPFADRRDEFSLLFRGPAAITLSSGTYQLAHPDLAPFELFLSVVQVDGPQDLAYEAVFN